jgi:hypothetical protein
MPHSPYVGLGIIFVHSFSVLNSKYLVSLNHSLNYIVKDALRIQQFLEQGQIKHKIKTQSHAVTKTCLNCDRAPPF